MKLLKVEKFKGSATEYINKYIIPTLPENNVLIEFSDSLDIYLKDKTNLRIIRKFGSSKFRGSRYTHQNINYIVSDNEAALWMYMQSMEDGVSDYKETIKNESMPIAFAITKEERERGLIYNKYGKQRREKEFSQLGYKHCHLFECSPRGKDLDYLNLNQRMIRLLNPMNHFPFPSNRKYEMPYDYGEKKEFLSLVLQQLLDRKYKTKNDRINFEEFIEKSGSSKLLKKKVEDFEINIGEKKEKRKSMKNINCHQMQRVEINNPIYSIEALVIKFQEWLSDNPCKRISGNDVGVAPHIFVEIDSQLFRIHSDTSKQAVEVFVDNFKNKYEFKIINNRNGDKVKATNNKDETPITGFYMYIHP